MRYAWDRLLLLQDLQRRPPTFVQILWKYAPPGRYAERRKPVHRLWFCLSRRAEAMLDRRCGIQRLPELCSPSDGRRRGRQIECQLMFSQLFSAKEPSRARISRVETRSPRPTVDSFSGGHPTVRRSFSSSIRRGSAAADAVSRRGFNTRKS